MFSIYINITTDQLFSECTKNAAPPIANLTQLLMGQIGQAKIYILYNLIFVKCFCLL